MADSQKDFLLNIVFNKNQATVAQLALKDLGQEALEAAQKMDSSFKLVSQTFSTTAKIINGQTVAQTNMTQVVENATGKLITYKGAVENTNTALQSGNAQLLNVTSSMAKHANTTKNLWQEYAQLAIRAIAVVPIWEAIRGVVHGAESVFTDATKEIIDVDTALARFKASFEGTGQSVGAATEQIKKASQTLAETLGVSMSESINTAKLFQGVFHDIEISMAGMNTTAKGTVATGADQTEIGNTLIDVYRAYGSSITGVTTPQEKLNVIMGAMIEIANRNGVSISQLGESIKNFQGTALGASVTFNQMLALLGNTGSTAERGAKAANQLASAFNQLSSSAKSEKITAFLGTDTTGLTPFNTILAVLEKMKSLLAQGIPINEDIATLFGLKGGKIVAGQANVIDNLIKQLHDLDASSPGHFMEVLNKATQDMTDTIQKQLDVFGKLKNELGEGFIEGVTGTKDFTTAMKTVNEYMKNTLIPTAKELADAIRQAFFGQGDENVLKEKPTTFLESVSPGNIIKALSLWQDIANAQNQKDIINANTENQSFGLDSRGQFINRPKRAATVAPWVYGSSNWDYDKSVSTNSQQAPDQAIKDQKDIDTINKTILSTQQELFKFYGASQSQLIQQKDTLSELLGLDKNRTNSIQRQLELQEALTKEQRLQSRLGNDSLKLFDIAKRFGTDTATKIGGVLQGKTSFNQFADDGGRAFQIFKQQFPELFKQQQALQFFTGKDVTGLPNLRGGANIPINEEAVRGIPRGLTAPTLQGLKDSRDTGLQRGVSIGTVQSNITVTVQDYNELAKKIEDIVVTGFRTAGSKINKGLAFATGGADNQTV